MSNSIQCFILCTLCLTGLMDHVMNIILDSLMSLLLWAVRHRYTHPGHHCNIDLFQFFQWGAHIIFLSFLYNYHSPKESSFCKIPQFNFPYNSRYHFLPELNSLAFITSATLLKQPNTSLVYMTSILKTARATITKAAIGAP